MSDDQEIPDDPPRPYTIHETFLGGMLGNVDSHHATLDEAIAIATARRQETCDLYRRQIVWPPTARG
jgi:hypothetical protein